MNSLPQVYPGSEGQLNGAIGVSTELGAGGHTRPEVF